MEILVAYDVATDTKEGQRRLRRVAQVCLNFGQRVQKSVFECSLDEMAYERLKAALCRIIAENEDSLRLYRLQNPKERFIEHFGRNRQLDFQKPLVI